LRWRAILANAHCLPTLRLPRGAAYGNAIIDPRPQQRRQGRSSEEPVEFNVRSFIPGEALNDHYAAAHRAEAPSVAAKLKISKC
jgi:hypothetical protein